MFNYFQSTSDTGTGQNIVTSQLMHYVLFFTVHIYQKTKLISHDKINPIK